MRALASDNPVKTLLAADRVALGVVCRSLSPVVVELIALAGFDFVWIDMEHTSATFQDVENLCRAGEAAGIGTLVRVADKSPSKVLRALEAGAGIVNVPQVEDHRDALAIVRAARYPPDGQRGFCPSSRGNAYGVGGETHEIFAAANRRVLTMVQLESRTGADNAAEISAVPGLDAVFIGLGDLALSLGRHDARHPEVSACADRIVDAARANGRTIAVLSETPEAARAWVARGARIVCCGPDIAIFRERLASLARDYGALRG